MSSVNYIYGDLNIGGLLTLYSTQSGVFRLQDTTEGLNKILVSDTNGVGTWTSSSSLGLPSGTGTTNYLPKWSSSTQLSTSLIYDNGSKVGIGLTNSAAILHVSNNGTSIPLIIASGSSTTDLVRITQVGTGNALVVEDSTNPDSTPFVVDSSGKVGIGTATPSYFMEAISNGGTDAVILFDGGSGANANLIARADTTIKVPSLVITDRNSNYSTDTSFFIGLDRTSGASPNLYVNRNDAVYVNNYQDKGHYFITNNSGSKGVRMSILSNGNVGVGLTAPSANLHVLGGTSSPVFKVDGTSGELFSIVDSLSGSLFSVNDISGLPIIEVFSDNSVIIGDYQASALFTTKKTNIISGTNSIYSFATASYDGAFIDYTAFSGSNARSGSLTAIWQGSNIQFNETSTVDIGNTSGLTFSFTISGTYAVFQASSNSNWTVKSIIRSI